MEQIEVYTDGGCTNNPGVGGYGIVILYPGSKDTPKTYMQGYENTTNNRMELLAVIRAILLLKNSTTPIVIYTDSKYVVDSINLRWVNKWKVTGYSTCKNPDLWKILMEIITPNITLCWIKGHSGNKWNELADDLSKKARSIYPLLVDRPLRSSRHRSR